ncbi:MAG: TM2 domain-containing protein, partial [Alphaproteobacteria bacterium]|nr:TM2 domain-containing protein [Alphaproteobacteria bacterium]
MPSLNFVLPDWVYWSGLIVFPMVAMYLVARQKRNGVPKGVSLFITYMFWLWSGFLGLHRFYLRSSLGVAFLAVFVAILYSNGQIRDLREDVSRTRSAASAAHATLDRARATSSGQPPAA